MAQPKWITLAGSLGTIPELTYYEIPLDAYDADGGGLAFSIVSGQLPLGLQIIPSGQLQGVPVSGVGSNNQQYVFTVRAKNVYGNVADRTFTINVTNIEPLVITPKNINLGTYFDGTLFNIQLHTIDYTPNAMLTWAVTNGELPLGLTLSQSGILYGYLMAIPAIGPASDPGWDDTSWDEMYQTTDLGWDFPIELVSKNYTFTIQVTDGLNIDSSTYNVLVFPRQDLVSSSTFANQPNGTIITADTTSIQYGFDFTNLTVGQKEFTVSETSHHYPIILTTQESLPIGRQNSYFSFQFSAFDIDGDVIQYQISPVSGSTFDEIDVGFDETYFSQGSLSIPGTDEVLSTTYIAAISSGTTLGVATTQGLYAGLLVSMQSGLGGDIMVVSILNSNQIIISASPIGLPSDGATVLFTSNSTLVINANSGWLTGRLPIQTMNQTTYSFELVVYKLYNPIYQTRKLFNLTVYGSLFDTVKWISSANLGSIENGAVSEFCVQAESTTGKTLYYTLTHGAKQRMPQGLQLNPMGLVYGRVSFESFSLDAGGITIDGGKTNFDSLYEFSVTASDQTGNFSATQLFSIRVVKRNAQPYENLYLKALPTRVQRNEFLDILADTSIFEPTLIYRNSDPYFGLAKDIKFLFLAGLDASNLSTYMNAVTVNHFAKRLVFGDIKTAVALDSKFNVQYEVIYIDVIDTASNSNGGAAADAINLSGIIQHPYYDQKGNGFNIAYPNGFTNMSDSVVASTGYSNRGALPVWMTSNQYNAATGTFSSPLGLTHGVVLAYTIPSASGKILYKLKQKTYNFNNFDFTIDRYQLDNVYSQNFDVTKQKYITSSETTFDRLVATSRNFIDMGTVNYAVSTPYEQLNKRYSADIQAIGGFDGVLDFNDGDLFVFALQEFNTVVNQFNYQALNDYNRGWDDSVVVWDGDAWAYNSNTTDNDNMPPSQDLTPGEPWDDSTFVAGYREFSDYHVVNKRAGIWKINIDSNSYVTLTFVQPMVFHNKISVQNGITYGGATIYFDPVIKTNEQVPSYTRLPRLPSVSRTTFDGNGTRYVSNRDIPVVPEEGDKYIKFIKLGVFT